MNAPSAWDGYLTDVLRLPPKPDWHRRVAGVAHRLTRPDCRKCGGADYIHLSTCARALRALTSHSPAMAFQAAVVRVWSLKFLWAQLTAIR